MPTKTAGKGLQRASSRVRYITNPDKPRPQQHAAKGARPCCAALEKRKKTRAHAAELRGGTFRRALCGLANHNTLDQLTNLSPSRIPRGLDKWTISAYKLKLCHKFVSS